MRDWAEQITKLTFNAEHVQRLIDHALRSPRHVATYEQAHAMLGDAWLRGDVDAVSLETKIDAALHLVKDDGIYLMSNGLPRYLNVAYADGYGAPSVFKGELARGDQYDKIRGAVGGDDFVLELPICDELVTGKFSEAMEFIVLLGQSHLSYWFERSAAR